MKCQAHHAFFKNLANPLKMRIVDSLKNDSKTVSDLGDELKVEQSNLSHALASLRACNVVLPKQEGKTRVYSLNKKTILPILKIIDKHAACSCKGCEFA